ncbi:hypothetical protein FCL47_03230 [Desulfopila sp. IMCC35006]|uniref:hypothetical protein n=1 Tax=Desulfopila sp. IMCC35006 TaxID=2569542 RepID=UPI0010AD6198|nr:hypothetical protein [Desulfopila sp. IMCC35006]TKB28509.1 hypothetical protein FCL47_03230 [Desulfopila sp. IMCC35006]
MNNCSAQRFTADPPQIRTGGYCRKCDQEHWLGPGNTVPHCRSLMHHLARRQTINLFSTGLEESVALETAPLFGPARGKMFGVMECLAPDGTTVIVHAFSGQYNGLWLVDGWAPPLFEVDEFLAMTVDTEKQIKQIGRQIDQCQPHSFDWLALRQERRHISRTLMGDIQSLYMLHNFRGEKATIHEAFFGTNGIPTGTGDCCAPKLLNFAAQRKLHPLGISEFFWGRENKSGGQRHTVFSSSCAEKCQPILGFMLCGLDTSGNNGKKGDNA